MDARAIGRAEDRQRQGEAAVLASASGDHLLEGPSHGRRRALAAALSVLGAVLALLAFHYGLCDYLFFGVLWPAVHPLLGIGDSLLKSDPWIDVFAGHTWALLLTLVALRLIFGAAWRGSAGLTASKTRLSLRLTWPACVAWVVVISAFFGLVYVVPRQTPGLPYFLTTSNVVGWLAFEWLYAGTVEEIKFRGLYQALVGRYWKVVVRLGGFALPASGVVAAALFALAHVSFSYVPFGIASANVPQILVWFVLSLYFSTVRQRTGSLVGPILVHNFNNGFSQVLLFALASLIK